MSVNLSLLIDKKIDLTVIEPFLFMENFVAFEDYQGLYVWYSDKYLSIRGCHLEISNNETIHNEFSEEDVYKTEITTITYAGRSYYDVEMQINILKKLQTVFGGRIYDPETELYEPFENFCEEFSATEIACGIEFKYFNDNIHTATSLIEKLTPNDLMNVQHFKNPLLIGDSVKRNNILLPFYVTVLETFLKEFIRKYLETNEEAFNKIFQINKDKINYETLKQIINNEKSVIDIEVGKYSFQNLNSANKAFKTFLDFDLNHILKENIEFGNQRISLDILFNKMIQSRHKLIHEAIMDVELCHETMQKYADGLQLFSKLFAKKMLEDFDLDLTLGDEYLLAVK